jgi:NAD(P)H-dependent nitrite reductase small subunit
MSTAILEASKLAVAGKKRVRLCSREDLVAGSGVVAWHEGHQIAIFYLPDRPEAAGEPSNRPEAVGELSIRPEAVGELYAVDNHDPFSGANVIGRGIVGDLNGELVVASPIYKQHFRLTDGQCLEDASQHLRTWSVSWNGDDVELHIPGEAGSQ